ncbi:hypothetical protein EGM51_14950 [Verrucomicrobia bacterium S94]|nr:hypothetical protein EGM51_14950 [Verrucomicrobia bacterium S94]
MLNVLKDFSERIGLGGGKPVFNPEVFNDPVALQTAWSPLKKGGASFRTQKLVEIDPDRLELRTTAGAILFSVLFAGMGLLAIGGGIAIYIQSDFSSFKSILPVLIGLVFTGAGGCMLYYFSTPSVFDRRNGFFWKGRKSPDEVVNRSRLKQFVEFDRIYALQLISEYCRSDKSSFYSYELNLILKDGSRINVFDHGKLDAARADAEKLSAFLNRPYWEGPVG